MRAKKIAFLTSLLLTCGAASASAGLEAPARSIEKVYADTSVRLDCQPQKADVCALYTKIAGKRQRLTVDFASFHAIPTFQILQLRAGHDPNYYVVTTSVECTDADEALAPDAAFAFCLLDFAVSSGKILPGTSVQVLPVYNQNLYRKAGGPA
jgi:hypothetical protein